MYDLPSGTVTFLFTDIEESTRRWEAHPDTMRSALARHDALVRAAIEEQNGYVFKTVGDAFCAAFSTAPDALTAAVRAQQSLFAEPETGTDSEFGGPMRVRMALHTGSAQERDGDYFGQPLNRVARLMSAGHGGQVLISQPTYELVRDHLPPLVALEDMGEHRLKDLIRPEHVYQLVVSGLPGDFPPLETLDYRPNNLPHQPTPLIGREKELGEIHKLLKRNDVRLITLTGPGGTGKTRLALQRAADSLDDFRDGVWLVDLSPITDPALVIPTVAQALGIKETGSVPLFKTVKSYLEEREILLLLDNFEQVVSAATQVSDLLASCQRLKVLITSRIPLRLRGEREYAVPPLALPDPSHLPSLEKLTQYEAVRLFIERAQSVQPGFEVNNGNAPAVAEICVRLDGLPLAIELAAARVKLLPPQPMLSRLQNRLKVLVGGARDLPARQQTIRSTIEWSYDLLSDGEKQLFRRMAVFQGGRTLEAIESVCNADNDLQVDVLDGVESLVNKSLVVQREEAEPGEPRFIMLETIQEYATEKLEESGEAARLRDGHLQYFVNFAEEADGHLSGPKQIEWLDRLENEHDNMRAAITWALEGAQHRSLLGLRLAANAGRFLSRCGYYTEGYDWLSKTMQSQPRPETIEGSRRDLAVYWAKAAREASDIALELGDYTAVRSLSEEAQSLCLELDDKEGVADTLLTFGLLALLTEGDLAKRQALTGQALALCREAGSKGFTWRALYHLGQVYFAQGDTSKATACYEEGLALSRREGNITAIAALLNNLGIIAYQLRDYIKSGELYTESRALYQQLRNKRGAAIATGNLGMVAMALGDFAQASALRKEELEIHLETGNRPFACSALLGLSDVARCEGDYVGARDLLEKGLDMARQIGDQNHIAEALYGLGFVAYHEGNYREAGKLARQSRELSGDYALFIPNTLLCLALANSGNRPDRLRSTVKLLGAIAAIRTSSGLDLWPPEQIEYDRAVTNLRAQLDEAAWAEAWSAGQAMTQEEALASALEDTPDE